MDEGVETLRSRARALCAQGQAAAALELLTSAVGDDLEHEAVPELLAQARAHAHLGRTHLQALASNGAERWNTLSAERAQSIVEALADVGAIEHALDLGARGALAHDARMARLRATWAMELRRYDAAIVAADIVIQSLLHEGLRVDQFVRLSLRGAPAEGLLRFARDAVAVTPSLHEPLALRWEALRRSGRSDEARAMRMLCLRHFPERASVWASAGNQALDDGELDQAEGYFDHCLRIAPRWTAAIAGKAIVLERRKDFGAALPYRARVVSEERALQKDDQASLQRVMRYAAALGRVGRWAEAGPLFRRCEALGTFSRVPEERAVLARVFSRELYAPAVVARLYAQAPAAFDAHADALALALPEAAALAGAYAALDRLLANDPGLRLQARGLCAWLAGDHARAYALLDEAEAHDEAHTDLVTQYALASSAAAIAAPELANITRFAVQAAEQLRARADRGETANEEQQHFARLTLARFGDERTAAVAPNEPQARTTAPTDTAAATTRSARPLAASTATLLAHLRALCARRAAELDAGKLALEVARASADSIAALARLLSRS